MKHHREAGRQAQLFTLPASESELLLHRLLASLPIHIVALDRNGCVTFSSGSPAAREPQLALVDPLPIGTNYLNRLRAAAALGNQSAAQLAEGVAAVLEGRLPSFTQESRNQLPEPRSHLVRVDRLQRAPGGAVISRVDTTEQSRSDAALREVHDRYAFATSAGGVGLWDLDVRSRDLYVDPSLIELLGFNRTVAGTTIVDWATLTTPGDRQALRGVLARCLRGDRADFEIEHRLIARDGRRLWFLTRGQVVPGPDGTPARLVGLSTHITERKEARLAIERQREKYRHIFRTAGVAIWDADYSVVARWLRRLRRRGLTDPAQYLENRPDLLRRALRSVRVCDVNTEAVRLTGAQNREKLLSLRLPDLLLNGEQYFLRQLAALAAGRTSFEAAATIRTLAGEQRDVVIVARFPNTGGHYDSVLLCVHDVTELVERRRRYEMAATAGGVTVFEMDLATREFRTDPPLHQLLQLDARQPVTLQHLVDRIHPEDSPRLLSTERALQSDNAPRDYQGNTPVPELDFRLLDGQGGCRWFLKRGCVIRGPDGRARKLVGTMTDITGQIRLEERVRRSHEQVRELAGRLIAAQEDEQTRIARDLHDGLGTQMAQVILELGQMEMQLAGESEELSSEIRRLQTEFRDLARGIRSLSRQMHPGTIERTQLLPALRRLCDEFARLQDIEVAIAFEGVDGPTPPDVTMSLYRVTQEALRNIARHSGAKKAAVTLTRRAQSIQLTIRDWGCGFHAPVGPPHGLGLLSIQERARLVGGQAYVVSAPGRGTEVRIAVPISADLLIDP